MNKTFNPHTKKIRKMLIYFLLTLSIQSAFALSEQAQKFQEWLFYLKDKKLFHFDALTSDDLTAVVHSLDSSINKYAKCLLKKSNQMKKQTLYFFSRSVEQPAKLWFVLSEDGCMKNIFVELKKIRLSSDRLFQSEVKEGGEKVISLAYEWLLSNLYIRAKPILIFCRNIFNIYECENHFLKSKKLENYFLPLDLQNHLVYKKKSNIYGNYVSHISFQAYRFGMQYINGNYYKDLKKIFLSLIENVEYIHSRNYVHRDIKLENVLLGQNTKEAYLIDFGAAAYCNSSCWYIPAGTVDYMDPALRNIFNAANIYYQQLRDLYPIEDASYLLSCVERYFPRSIFLNPAFDLYALGKTLGIAYLYVKNNLLGKSVEHLMIEKMDYDFFYCLWALADLKSDSDKAVYEIFLNLMHPELSSRSLEQARQLVEKAFPN